MMGKNAKALVFNTDFTVEHKKVKIKDGYITVDDKEFPVDGIRPVIMKKRGRYREPLYLLKWDCLLPAQFELKKDNLSSKDLMSKFKMNQEPEHDKYTYKRLVPIIPEFRKTKMQHSGLQNPMTILPSTLKDTTDMRFLKGMKNYVEGGGGKPKPMQIIIMFALGMLLMFLMFNMGVVTI